MINTQKTVLGIIVALNILATETVYAQHVALRPTASATLWSFAKRHKVALGATALAAGFLVPWLITKSPQRITPPMAVKKVTQVAVEEQVDETLLKQHFDSIKSFFYHSPLIEEVYSDSVATFTLDEKILITYGFLTAIYTMSQNAESRDMMRISLILQIKKYRGFETDDQWDALRNSYTKKPLFETNNSPVLKKIQAHKGKLQELNHSLGVVLSQLLLKSAHARRTQKK